MSLITGTDDEHRQGVRRAANDTRHGQRLCRGRARDWGDGSTWEMMMAGKLRQGPGLERTYWRSSLSRLTDRTADQTGEGELEGGLVVGCQAAGRLVRLRPPAAPAFREGRGGVEGVGGRPGGDAQCPRIRGAPPPAHVEISDGALLPSSLIESNRV